MPKVFTGSRQCQKRLFHVAMVSSLLGMVIAMLMPFATAYAATPGRVLRQSGITTLTKIPQRVPVQPDAAWLAAKNAHRIISGIRIGYKVKGTAAHPYIIPIGKALLIAVTPRVANLTLDQYATNTWEPSDGSAPNNGAGSSSKDDQGNVYHDHNFFDLCGPGAADIALDFWPNPPNLSYNYADDPAYDAYTGSTHISYWNGSKMRGYMTILAWSIQPPTWPTAGMMDVAHYPSAGVTQYSMVEGLNWEASGRNAANWQNYFYALRWWSDPGINQGTLLSDVMSDIATSHVPVVAEVNAALLPNWNVPAGQSVHHYITIVGYDNNAGTYRYTDTCARTTNCNPGTSNYDGGYKTVSQATMWNAITSIPVNKSGAYNAGDGGWVW